MSETKGTGIEVTTHFLDKDSALVRVFGFLHMTKLVALLIHQYKLEIVIDGEVHKEKDPLVSHFVACPPGDHAVKVTLLGWEGMNHLYNEATGTIRVEPGKVTLVHYNFKAKVMLPGDENTEIVAAGSRDANP